MSDEKNKEEIKEQIMKANALADEELKKVSGGNVDYVSADRTTCLYEGWVHSYDPIDIKKPQSCGNCRLYFPHNGFCTRSTGG